MYQLFCIVWHNFCLRLLKQVLICLHNSSLELTFISSLETQTDVAALFFTEETKSITISIIIKKSIIIKNVYVNSQNCRIRDDTIPHEIQKRTMYLEKAAGWCGFWAGGVIGAYFFKNDIGHQRSAL